MVVSVGRGILDKFKPSRAECDDHNVGLVRHDVGLACHDVKTEYTCIKFPGFMSVSDTD